MRTSTRFLRSLSALGLALAVDLSLGGCEGSTSSDPITTNNTGINPPATQLGGSDTLTTDSLAKTETFANTSVTYYVTGGTVTGDLVFGRKVTVVVLGTITVTGSLTFREGGKVYFDQGTYLDVTSGRLGVLGSDSLPILLKNHQAGKRWGYQASDVYTGGIRINSNASPLTAIKHAKIDSATTGIYLNVSGVAIDSSSIANSQYQSIFYDGAIPGSLKNNTYANNGECSIRLGFDGLTALDGSGTFIGAKSNVLVLSATASASGTIPSLPVPYEFSRDGETQIANSSGVEVEIQAGTHFLFQDNSWLKVGNSATLKISGTASNPVTFGPVGGKRWGHSLGDGGGIWIYSNASPNTTIKHLILDSTYTGIYVDVSGVTIDSSVFQANAIQSVFFDDHTVPGSLKGNTYADNGVHSIRLAFNGLIALDGSGVFTGDNTDIYVERGSITSNGTIPNFAAKYLLDGEEVIGGTGSVATVTVAPGTYFKTTKSNGFYVDRNGALVAVGTANLPIVFANAVPGTEWGYDGGGIYLATLSSNLTHIANATFYGVVNNIPVEFESPLSGVVTSPITVLPAI
jgi:hypothetical protein